jgi:hypothetical protein
MKAIIKFDLNNEDEVYAHLRCLKSTDMAMIFWEIEYNFYRRLEIDGDSAYNQGVLDTIEKIRNHLEEDGIIIDNLIN